MCVYRNIFFLVKTYPCALGSVVFLSLSSFNTIVTFSSYSVWSTWSYRHWWNLMRCVSLLGLVLRLVYASCIQIGNWVCSQPWQKVAHTVSAAAASVSTSAAARRDVAAVSFPAAHTLSMYWMLLGCAWVIRGVHELVAEEWNRWWESCRICNLLQTFRDLFWARGGWTSSWHLFPAL